MSQSRLCMHALCSALCRVCLLHMQETNSPRRTCVPMDVRWLLFAGTILGSRLLDRPNGQTIRPYILTTTPIMPVPSPARHTHPLATLVDVLDVA